ncbi:MAG TPA: hypothetical protein VJI46_02540 [Candidatus Nanoarchaeia archaeon]|nr:hypothetical protein [Candidatus Nanoarchaeia archaeon]
METVTVRREEFEMMVREIESLRNTKVYQRLLEFEHNIKSGKKYGRKDLGF